MRAAWSVPRATAFRGAVNNRLTEDWILASIRSADAEVRGDLRVLRKRARELARNTAHLSRFVDLLADNIVGPHGIRLQSRPLRLDGELDEEAAKKIEEAWNRWGDPDSCTADGLLSWHGIQELIVQTEAMDGEGILRLLPGFNNEFGFAVQALDSDQLDEEFNRPAGNGKNQIRMGVEINKWGRPGSFWLWDSHPFDFQGSVRRNRIQVPAEQLIHRYQIRRPGQTRGVSWFAPILMQTQMLVALQEAEIIASRISAAKSGVFKYTDASAAPDPDQPHGAIEDFQWDMEPGVFDVLPPGLKATFFDPTHPNSAFESFNKIILHTIAAGLRTSYHSLTGDLREVNFSSIRQGSLQERDIYRRLQRRTWTHVHTRVFRMWLKWALTMGAIDLPLRDIKRLERHEWQGRGWPNIDPLKDDKAHELAIKLGLNSRTRIAAEQGRDFADVIDELAREAELARRKGVDLSAGPASDGGALAVALLEADEETIAEVLSQLSGDTLAAALLEADEDVLVEAFGRLNGRGSRIADLMTRGAT